MGKENQTRQTFLKIAYTPTELAEMLGINSNRIRKWIKDGHLRANRMGRSWLIPQAEVRRLSGLNPPDLDAFIAWANEGVILDNTGVAQHYDFPPEKSPYSLPDGAQTQRKTEFKSDKLENELETMCRQANFYGAVLSDATGLVVADFNSPFEPDHVAAYASVLEHAVEESDKLLNLQDISDISIGINTVDKLVATRFIVDAEPYFLMIFCPRKIDEKPWLDNSIKRLEKILTGDD